MRLTTGLTLKEQFVLNKLGIAAGNINVYQDRCYEVLDNTVDTNITSRWLINNYLIRLDPTNNPTKMILPQIVEAPHRSLVTIINPRQVDVTIEGTRASSVKYIDTVTTSAPWIELIVDKGSIDRDTNFANFDVIGTI